VESEGRQMKQCRIKYTERKKIKKIPLLSLCPKPRLKMLFKNSISGKIAEKAYGTHRIKKTYSI
jgi:hypothetical protein